MKQDTKSANTEEYESFEYLKNKFVELSLMQCGYKKGNAGTRMEPGRIHFYIFFMVMDGKGVFEVNGSLYAMEKGSTIFIYPGMEYAYEADAQNPWTYAWIQFAGVKAEECVLQLGYSTKNLMHIVEDVDSLYSLIRHMQEANELTFANELRRNGLLKLFLANLVEQYEKQMSGVQARDSYQGEASSFVQKTMAYIAENYASKIKINELADYVGVNRSYLASSFKKVTGYSPKEYLLSLRMERAKSLLKKTDMSINAIANSVGYADQLAFSRMFKRYTGISPKNYREEG